VNRNYPVSAGGSVRDSATDLGLAGTAEKTRNGMKAACLAVAVLAAAGIIFYFSTSFSTSFLSSLSASRSTSHRTSVRASGNGPVASEQSSLQRISADESSPLLAPGSAGSSVGSSTGSRRALPARAVSLPLFFEPNVGQTAAPVKFLAHGSGYGLFLTGDEAVLEVQHVEAQNPEAQPASAARRGSRHTSSSVIRMRIDGANASARVSGASPMRGTLAFPGFQLS